MRKLWNRPDAAVWSLVTQDAAGLPNMNICTYVTSISMEPKLMLVAVYTGTKTLENLQTNKRALLQLLTEPLAPAVRVCGQQSGKKIAKIPRLQKRFELSEHNGLPYFTQAAGFMEVEFIKPLEVEGDHVLFYGQVLHAKNLHDVPLLTTEYLKRNKFTR